MRIPLNNGHVDLNTHEVQVGGQKARLTPNEAQLLGYLVERPGQTIEQAELLREVFQYSEKVRSRTVVTTMQRLRGKLEVDPTQPVHLINVYGVGYRFEPLQAEGALFGREEELEEIHRRLGEGRLWLVAPGGFGKTALARVASERIGERPLWVDLSDAKSEGDLAAAIAQALGFEQLESQALGLALEHHAPSVLIFDAADEVGVVLGGLLGQWELPLPVLVTSRMPSPEEPCMNVGPLNHQDSKRLFERHAPENLDAQAIAPLLERLNGIPLALELAAARLAVYSPEELDSSVLDLASILAGGVGRHASMGAVLAWSWAHTPAAMKEALAAFSTARGGLKVALAAELAGTDGLTLLTDLLRWGWVYSQGGRVRLLDPVREFVVARADITGAKARHLRLFLGLAQDRREGLLSGGEGPFLREEWGNLQAAFSGGLAHGDPAAAELVLLLAVPMIRRMPTPEALSWFDKAVDLAQGQVLVDLLMERANLWMVRDSLAAAELDLERAQSLGCAKPGLLAYRRAKLLRHREQFEAAIEELSVALQGLKGTRALNAQTELGFCLMRAGRADEAPPILKEALARARLMDLPGPALLALGTLAALYTEQERFEEAEQAYRAALELCTKIGDRANAAPLHNNLGNLFFYTGRAEGAETEWRTTLQLSLRLGSRRGAALAETNLAQLAILQGDGELARQGLERAREGFEAVGAPSGTAFVLFSLGRLCAREEAWEEAESWFERAEPKLPGSVLWWLAVERSVALAEQGEPAAARRALAESPEPTDRSSEVALLLAGGFCTAAEARAGEDPEDLARSSIQEALVAAAPIAELPIVELAQRLKERAEELGA